MQSPEKPTRFGIFSFTCAVLVFVLWCGYTVVFGMMSGNNLAFGMDGETAGYALIFGGGALMAALTILLTLAGIVFGVLALRKGDPKRGLAIAGIVLNFLCLAPYCLMGLLVLFSSFPGG